MLGNEDKKIEGLDIKILKNINNKADLYENIVKLILYKHQNEKPNDNTYLGDKEDIKEKLENNLIIL